VILHETVYPEPVDGRVPEDFTSEAWMGRCDRCGRLTARHGTLGVLLAKLGEWWAWRGGRLLCAACQLAEPRGGPGCA